VAGNPTPWHVEVAPNEFKLFGECTRDDLEAATGLIEDRAANRELTAGHEFDDDVSQRARSETFPGVGIGRLSVAQALGRLP
jgi:hypothetical protein